MSLGEKNVIVCATQTLAAFLPNHGYPQVTSDSFLFEGGTRPGGNQIFYLETRNLLTCSWGHVFIFIRKVLTRNQKKKKKITDIHRTIKPVSLLRWLISCTQD